MTLSTRTIAAGSQGLYAAKPTFQRLLANTSDWLARRRVDPDALTFAAVGCGLVGGTSLLAASAKPQLLWSVPVLAVIRLALNALDGMVAVRRGCARPWGKVLNEVGDRFADLAFFGPLLFVPGADVPLMAAALCAMLLSSYVGVLAEAAGAGRQYGGVLGKADRMVWLSLAAVLAAVTGSLMPLRLLPAVLLVGGIVTLVQRGARAHAAL